MFNAMTLRDACIKFIVEKKMELDVPHQMCAAVMKELCLKNTQLQFLLDQSYEKIWALCMKNWGLRRV